MTEESEELPKPHELLAARSATEELFATLRDWFGVPDYVTIDLRGVDSAVGELGDPQYVMAMAMRKLQALHLLTTPGVVTTTDVVLTVIQDLERALLQAPNMHLRSAAAETDWDAALAELDDHEHGDATGPLEQPENEGHEGAGGAEGGPGNGGPGNGGPGNGGPGDGGLEAFRRHHAALHEAARAVLRASDGEIRRLI